MKQKFFKVFFFSLLILAVSPGVIAQSSFPLPVGMNLEYVFYRGNTQIGTMQRTLTRSDEDHYVLESNVKVTHFFARLFLKGIVERSTFTFENNRAKPLQYLHHRSGSKKSRNQNLNFDWDTGQISDTGQVSDNSQATPWTLDIPANTVDRHLYQLNVMFDMQNEPASLQYLVVDKGKLKTYNVENLGSEAIATPLGEINTIKLLRQTEKRSTTIWVAPEYNYLPVQIEQNEKGQKFRSVIKKIDGLK